MKKDQFLQMMKHFTISQKIYNFEDFDFDDSNTTKE